MRQSCGSVDALNAFGGALADLFDIFQLQTGTEVRRAVGSGESLAVTSTIK
ncbi:MAG: hypothetical protein LBI10_11250 [Deltaproteobacteria bacterium]|nr:hypothetical protein [Deltaproteobacteria bacterium]